MKPISLFIAIATSAILSSCIKTAEVNNDNYNNYDPTVLSFTSRVVGTKAIDKTNNWIYGDILGVFAKVEDENFESGTFSNTFMNNLKVNYFSSWIIDSINSNNEQYFWPAIESKQTVTFFAYHPWVDKNVEPELVPTISSGIVGIPWVVKDLASTQEDLLYAVIKNATTANRSGATDPSKYKNTGPIEFTFNHALSKISFRARLNSEVPGENEEVKNKNRIFIDSIKVLDVYGAGTLNFSGDLIIDNTNTWTHTTPQNENFRSFAVSDITPIISSFEVSYYEDANKYANIGDDITTENVDEGDKNNSLLMIPQQLSNNSKIQLAYRVGKDGPTKIQNYSLSSVTNNSWDANKHYIYTFNIAPGTGVISTQYEIKFGYDVGEWDPDSPTIAVPELPVANSYMIKPGTDNADNRNIIKIPVIKRINQFWADQAGGGVQDDKPSVPEKGRGNSITTANAITDTDEWHASIIWADFDYNTSNLVILEGGTAGNEFLTVKVGQVTDGGNIVIGVKKGAAADEASNAYLWSWHLWITNYEPSISSTIQDGYGTTRMNNGSGGSFVAMDRNLGAKNATKNNVGSLGLLYQWGRKDPFVGAVDLSNNTIATVNGTAITVEASGTLQNSVYNPNEFYKSLAGNDWITIGELSGTAGYNRWGGATNHTNSAVPTTTLGEKTIYDPCPPGWRVPTAIGSTTWAATTTFSAWDINGATHTPTADASGGAGVASWFPAAGNLGVNGVLTNNATIGGYWSGANNATKGYFMSIENSANDGDAVGDKATGRSVRPILDISYK